MKNLFLTWAIQELNKNGYEISSTVPDIIQNTEWSTVYRFLTNRGFVFLKKIPSALSIEPNIIDILSKEFNASVPCIIAINDKENCFLMQDAGIQLNQAFKENFKSDIFIQMMKEYIKLQINTTNKIEFFLEMGVPDWRLEKLPKLYDELIAEEELLIKDGLNKTEISTLKNKSSQLIAICEKLSSYKVKDTFGHADFHDKNILIDPSTNRTTLIDLGEVVITHPFFSLHNCLHMAKENFSLTDSQHYDLVTQCYQPWLEFESQKNILEILNLIQQCWSVHAVLGEKRLIKSVAPIDSLKLLNQQRLSNKLRYWINQL